MENENEPKVEDNGIRDLPPASIASTPQEEIPEEKKIQFLDELQEHGAPIPMTTLRMTNPGRISVPCDKCKSPITCKELLNHCIYQGF